MEYEPTPKLPFISIFKVESTHILQFIKNSHMLLKPLLGFCWFKLLMRVTLGKFISIYLLEHMRCVATWLGDMACEDDNQYIKGKNIGTRGCHVPIATKGGIFALLKALNLQLGHSPTLDSIFECHRNLIPTNILGVGRNNILEYYNKRWAID